MSSQIAAIVDYTAQVAAGIEGISAVYGCGQGSIGDPLNPGQTVQAAPDAPTGIYTHWSDMPDAPRIEWITQGGVVQYTWDVPMRLWLPRVDLANLRRNALPFYDRYLHAFLADHTLGGLCLIARPSKFERGSDDLWAWLDVNLEVTEEVAY